MVTPGVTNNMADASKKLSRSKERLNSKLSSLQQSDPKSYETDDNTSRANTIDSLVWKDLTEEQVISLIDLSPNLLESKLAEILLLYKYHICLKEACMIDFYVSAFWFAKQAKFSTEQVSAFFSLVKILLENIKEEKMSIMNNIREMKGFMSSNSEKTASLFRNYQIKLITDYLTESFFQQYKLYEHLFFSPTDEPVIRQRLSVEVPPAAETPFPAPLDEGLPEEIHREHVLGLKHSSLADCDNIKVTQSAVDVQDDIQVENKDTSHIIEQTQEALYISLKPEEIKQALNDVSDGILSEVKTTVQKKLKDRELAMLKKMSKK